ncbi:MAG TPA: hypothetical protein VFB80_12630 [Pirellulaceae bacterium]|nr:hypothetical protein [Pirellulaceae bacterium]
MSRWNRLLAAAVLLALLASSPAAQAGPPAYLLLRRAESPGRHFHAGHADAAMYDARASGYAYGYFGAAPRSHFSRHYGYYDTYKQWSRW